MQTKIESSDSEPNSLHEIQMLVLAVLQNRIQGFSVDYLDSGIVLSGICDSFHVKQMAQEIILHHTHLKIVANNMVVQYARSSSLSNDLPN